MQLTVSCPSSRYVVSTWDLEPADSHFARALSEVGHLPLPKKLGLYFLCHLYDVIVLATFSWSYVECFVTGVPRRAASELPRMILNLNATGYRYTLVPCMSLGEDLDRL